MSFWTVLNIIEVSTGPVNFSPSQGNSFGFPSKVFILSSYTCFKMYLPTLTGNKILVIKLDIQWKQDAFLADGSLVAG